jgi:hypothetical protein
MGRRRAAGVANRLSRLNIPVRFFAAPQYHVIELRQGEAGLQLP